MSDQLIITKTSGLTGEAPKGQKEIGFATSISNYIVWVNGLPNVNVYEIVESKSGGRGFVNSIEQDLVEVLMLDDVAIHPQEEFTRTYQQLEAIAGSNLLGRAINSLGQPIDGKGPLGPGAVKLAIDQPPASIKSRDFMVDQFPTGVTLVDMLVPVAYGQRELVIGDGHSGRTGFLLDTVINQKGRKTICIYGLVGKPINEIKNVLEILRVNKALDYTVVIATSSSEKASVIYLNPAIATTVAEYFQKKGFNVLLILDDMGIHAKFYREIALLSGKSPGRDSYPGDIFYQHAKLMERAGKFNSKFGGGSITALPVIETTLDDYSSYITTNLMSMTDGHLLFSASRYHQGIRPSVDVSLSVSRVGRQTQSLAQKSLADKIKALLVQATKLQSFSRLGSEVSSQTQLILKQGRQIEIILKQNALTNIPIILQMILLGLIFTPFLMNKEAEFLEANKQKILDYLTSNRNLENYVKEIIKMPDEKVFIESLNRFIPDLEKVTTNKSNG